MLYVIFDAVDGLTEQDALDFVQAVDAMFNYPKHETQHHTSVQKHPLQELWRVDVGARDPDTRMYPLDVVIPNTPAKVENISPCSACWNPILPP